MTYEFGRSGIPPSEWLTWTFDQVDLYLRGMALSVERAVAAVKQIRAAVQPGGDAGVRFVVPLK